MGQPYAVVIGGANVDICGASDAPVIAGDSNPGKVSISVGGVGRNIADNLARLGGTCYLLSAIGCDSFGQMIRTQTEAAGVNMASVLESGDYPTPCYLSVLDECGDLSVAINDMSAVSNISPDYLEQHASLIDGANLVIIDANLPVETLRFISERFGYHYIIADGVSASKVGKFAGIISAINVLKVNLAEGRVLCDMPDGTPERVALALFERGSENIFITLGADGVYFKAQDQQGLEKPVKNVKQVQNVTGAGDAFVAGLAYGYLDGWPIHKTVSFANAAAYFATQSAETINKHMSHAAVMRIMD